MSNNHADLPFYRSVIQFHVMAETPMAKFIAGALQSYPEGNFGDYPPGEMVIAAFTTARACCRAICSRGSERRKTRTWRELYFLACLLEAWVKDYAT